MIWVMVVALACSGQTFTFFEAFRYLDFINLSSASNNSASFIIVLIKLIFFKMFFKLMYFKIVFMEWKSWLNCEFCLFLSLYLPECSKSFLNFPKFFSPSSMLCFLKFQNHHPLVIFAFLLEQKQDLKFLIFQPNFHRVFIFIYNLILLQ
jgi:hypothetical protein